jgi:hypothetical protein
MADEHVLVCVVARRRVPVTVEQAADRPPATLGLEAERGVLRSQGNQDGNDGRVTPTHRVSSRQSSGSRSGSAPVTTETPGARPGFSRRL